jgi:hypothetical protein
MCIHQFRVLLHCIKKIESTSNVTLEIVAKKARTAGNGRRPVQELDNDIAGQMLLGRTGKA